MKVERSTHTYAINFFRLTETLKDGDTTVGFVEIAYGVIPEMEPSLTEFLRSQASALREEGSEATLQYEKCFTLNDHPYGFVHWSLAANTEDKKVIELTVKALEAAASSVDGIIKTSS